MAPFEFEFQFKMAQWEQSWMIFLKRKSSVMLSMKQRFSVGDCEFGVSLAQNEIYVTEMRSHSSYANGILAPKELQEPVIRMHA